MDPNLVEVAKFLSVYLENDENFYQFGVALVSNRKVDVKIIARDPSKSLPNRCLALLELWIRSAVDPQWQDLIEAARASGFGGLARALAAKFGSQRGSQRGSQKEEQAVGEGDCIGIINCCVLTI